MLTDSQEAGHVPYVYEEISFLSFLLFSKISVFSFKVAYEQALYLGQSREVTREQNAKLMTRVRGAAGSLRSP